MSFTPSAFKRDGYLRYRVAFESNGYWILYSFYNPKTTNPHKLAEDVARFAHGRTAMAKTMKDAHSMLAANYGDGIEVKVYESDPWHGKVTRPSIKVEIE